MSFGQLLFYNNWCSGPFTCFASFLFVQSRASWVFVLFDIDIEKSLFLLRRFTHEAVGGFHLGSVYAPRIVEDLKDLLHAGDGVAA